MTSGRLTPARAAAIGALAVALVLVAWLLLHDKGGHAYRVELQNGGQLVKGNQVLIGGVPAGSVESVELTDNSQAEVKIRTDRELHEGTSAVVRSTSLSGVANRYISLSPGPDNFPPLGSDAVISTDKTTSAVDLDQLFNTFDDPTRKALQNVIQGSAAAYAGRGQQANQAYLYLSPSLVATDRLLRELGRDQQTLSDFLVSSSRVVTAVAARRTDLAELVPNANEALGAIAEHNRSFDQALRGLPGALRQGNTTFSNFRDALNDLDPLVETSKTATKDLAPFLKRVRPVVKKSVPVFTNLALAVRNTKNDPDDLAEALRDLPGLQGAAAAAMQPTIDAMVASNPIFKFARPYMPDVLNLITKLGEVTAYYDADGHYARVQPGDLGIFHYNAGSQFLEPIPPSQQFDDLQFDIFKRCPGGATQAVAGSNPFLDNGNLSSPSDCNASQVPPGP